MAFVQNFLIPTIEVTFLVGIGGFVFFYVGKALHNAWSKQTKFWFKFKVQRKPYSEKYIRWVLECVDQGIGYYDAKKKMMVSSIPESQMWEILYIYDRIIDELNLKGGLDKNGRKFERCDSKTKDAELPNL